MATPSVFSAIRRVVLYPNPVLRQKCVPVVFGGSDGKKLPPSIAQLAADLAATAKDEDGLGLAAPQVGEAVSMFAMLVPVSNAITALLPSAASVFQPRGRSRGGPAHAARKLQGPATTYRVVINPEILAKSEHTELGLEGCLSVPEMTCLVRRSSSIDVRYYDVFGTRHEERIQGLPAVVFQHEYDHMEGVMHSDREAQAYSQGNRQELVAAAVKKYMAQLLHHYNIVIPSSAISPADF